MRRDSAQPSAQPLEARIRARRLDRVMRSAAGKRCRQAQPGDRRPTTSMPVCEHGAAQRPDGKGEPRRRLAERRGRIGRRAVGKGPTDALGSPEEQPRHKVGQQRDWELQQQADHERRRNNHTRDRPGMNQSFEVLLQRKRQRRQYRETRKRSVARRPTLRVTRVATVQEHRRQQNSQRDSTKCGKPTEVSVP